VLNPVYYPFYALCSFESTINSHKSLILGIKFMYELRLNHGKLTAGNHHEFVLMVQKCNQIVRLRYDYLGWGEVKWILLWGRMLSSSVFRLRHGFTPSIINRAGGFLRREAFICLERTSIRAGLFLLDTYLEFAEWAITNCIRHPPPYPKTDDLRKKYCIIGIGPGWTNTSWNLHFLIFVYRCI